MIGAFSIPALEQGAQTASEGKGSYPGGNGHALPGMDWIKRVTHIRTKRERAERLAKAIWSLEEPWRSRFLVFLIGQVTHGAGDDHSPEPEEVVTWLSDHKLYQMMASMMDAWRDGGRCSAA